MAKGISHSIIKARVPGGPAPKEKRVISPETIVKEIENAVRRLNRIFKSYEDIGDGLETQVHLIFTADGKQLNFSLNNEWSESMKESVRKTILQTAAKYPQVIARSTP